LKTPDQENCQEGPNGECVVPAYQTLDFNITQYTDDNFFTESSSDVLIANDMVYLAVEAKDINANTTFAIRQCSFKKGDISITMINPEDAQPVCTNDLIDLEFRYETDENGDNIRFLIKHRLFVLRRGNADFYQLSCDVTVCDINENGNTCEQLRAQCDDSSPDYRVGCFILRTLRGHFDIENVNEYL
jgi:hypothetical protein